jgi:hypothetical protein
LRRHQVSDAVIMIAVLKQMYGEPMRVSNRRLLNVRDGVAATCLKCGLDIEKNVAQYRARLGPAAGYVHAMCPGIANHVPALKTRKYDFVLTYIRDALPQCCARCACRAQTPYTVVTRDSLDVIRVCAECVKR